MADTTHNNYLIFIGNPGVGKSTLLNGLVGHACFKSGFSAGTGMTQHLQLFENASDGVVYGDTPGLDDIESRERAAAQIAEALRQNGTYRLVFVVTMEAGRARPGDVATMQIVLDAIDKDVGYGIIVNKVSGRALAALSDENTKSLLFTSLAVGHSASPFIILNELDMDLFDADNQIAPISQELAKFLDALPRVNIAETEVADLCYDDLERLRESFNSQIALLRRDAAAREAALQSALDDLRSKSKRRGWYSDVLSWLPIPAVITEALADAF